MFDTMTVTKIVGGFGGTLLVFLLGSWAAEAIYSVGSEHGEEEQAYSIEVPEGADGGGGMPSRTPSRAAVMRKSTVLPVASATPGGGLWEKT